jgi:anti-sigma B factor antagonist
MADKASRLKTSRRDVVTVVELVDKRILDETAINQIGQQLFKLAAREEEPRIVLDFSNVAHMSSSMLGTLITLHKRVREKGGQLVLCRIHAPIAEVFQITRLNEVFQITPDADEAVQLVTSGEGFPRPS